MIYLPIGRNKDMRPLMADDDMRTRILDAAEQRAREGGYHGFSFREVAADVGIKSASVHYHFPTKTALATALAERYTERSLEVIGTPETPLQAFDRVCELFRHSAAVERKMCLCGLFGAERDGLPPEVAKATQSYFTRLIAAIQAPSVRGEAPFRAETILSTLEGALLVARAIHDLSVFDHVVTDLRRAYENQKRPT